MKQPSRFGRSKRKAKDVEPTWDSDDFGVKEEKGKGKFWCDLCNVGCSSEALFGDHCRGKKHKARESMEEEFEKGEEDEFYCDICNVWCNSGILLNSHLNGKKHKLNKSKKDEIGDVPHGKDEEKEGPWCEICKVRCNSEAMMKNHLNGKKHKANEARVRMYVEEEEEVSDEEEDEFRSDPQGHTCSEEKKEKIFNLGCKKDEEGSDPSVQTSKEEKKDEIFDVGRNKDEESSDPKEKIVNVGCKEDEEVSDPLVQTTDEVEKDEIFDVGRDKDEESGDRKGQMSDENGDITEPQQANENANGKNLGCEECKEFWCLLCRVKCESRVMMTRHLKGMEHKDREALRRDKRD